MPPVVGSHYLYDATLQSQGVSLRWADPIYFLAAISTSQEARNEYENCHIASLEHRKAQGDKQHEFVVAEVIDARTKVVVHAYFERTTSSETLQLVRTSRTVRISSPRLHEGTQPEAIDLITVNLPRDGEPVHPDYQHTKPVRGKIFFHPQQFTIVDLAVIHTVIHRHRPVYRIDENQCYWYANVLYAAVHALHLNHSNIDGSIVPGAISSPVTEEPFSGGGTYLYLPIPQDGHVPIDVLRREAQAIRQELGKLGALAALYKQDRIAELERQLETSKRAQEDADRARADAERALDASEQRTAALLAHVEALEAERTRQQST